MIDNSYNSFYQLEYQNVETISNVLHNVLVFGNLPFGYAHAFMWKVAPGFTSFWEWNPEFIPNGFFAFITLVIYGLLFFVILTLIADELIEYNKRCEEAIEKKKRMESNDEL